MSFPGTRDSKLSLFDPSLPNHFSSWYHLGNWQLISLLNVAKDQQLLQATPWNSSQPPDQPHLHQILLPLIPLATSSDLSPHDPSSLLSVAFVNSDFSHMTAPPAKASLPVISKQSLNKLSSLPWPTVRMATTAKQRTEKQHVLNIKSFDELWVVYSHWILTHSGSKQQNTKLRTALLSEKSKYYKKYAQQCLWRLSRTTVMWRDWNDAGLGLGLSWLGPNLGLILGLWVAILCPTSMSD